MKKIKVGIVGTRGLQMMLGLKSIPDVEITAMCDLDEEHLNKSADEHGIEKRYRVFEDMLDSDIDAVVISTPMQCHMPQTVAAMEAGKHVLSEVTAGVSMDELWWLCEAVEKYNKIYMYAENYIYTPEVQLVKIWCARACSANRITQRVCICTIWTACSHIRTARRRGAPTGSAASAAISIRRTRSAP